jgi:hypothetical protein
VPLPAEYKLQNTCLLISNYSPAAHEKSAPTILLSAHYKSLLFLCLNICTFKSPAIEHILQGVCQHHKSLSNKFKKRLRLKKDFVWQIYTYLLRVKIHCKTWWRCQFPAHSSYIHSNFVSNSLGPDIWNNFKCIDHKLTDEQIFWSEMEKLVYYSLFPFFPHLDLFTKLDKDCLSSLSTCFSARVNGESHPHFIIILIYWNDQQSR